MFQTLFTKFSGSPFAKNVLLLTSGTALAQLIPIILQPFLRRMFSPAEYGVYSIYLSIVGILTIIATFRYDNAIVLPRSNKKAINILGLSTAINLGFNLVLLAILILFHEWVNETLKIPSRFSYIIYLIPAGVFLFCFQQTINFWLIRKTAFGASSINKITRRSMEGITHISLGLNKVPSGLILGDIAGGIASAISGWYQALKKELNFRLINWKILRFVAIKYSDFPKFNMLPTLLSSIAFQMPVLLINQFFDAKKVGEFDLARQMLNVPLAFIAITFSQVLLQSLTEKKQKSLSVMGQLKGVLYMILTIVVIELVFISLWGPELFGLVFGKNWIASGKIAQVLVLNFALNFILSSFTSVFISFNKLKLYSVWQISYFGAMLLLLSCSHVSFESFLAYYVILDSLLIISGIVLVSSIIYGYERTIRSVSTN